MRKELIEKPCNDIRLLYLAIHHIVKYRGHFLIEDGFKECKDIVPYFKKLNIAISARQEECSVGIDDDDVSGLTDCNDIGQFDLTKVKNLESIVTMKISNKDKKSRSCDLLNVTKAQKTLVESIFGGMINPTTMFGKGVYEKESVKSFKFSDNYAELESTVKTELKEYDFAIITALKEIYDWQVITKVLNGGDSLSTSMVEIYNKHKQDLKELKALITKYAPNNYSKMFAAPISSDGKKIDEKNNNYSKYIGVGRFDGEKVGGNGRLGDSCKWIVVMI